ncbi:MAG: hypothetical protein DMG57_30515 [Acidobacteria bacterium]|nr:MAG: hypothetical protein DMG57_30515 [Acidobacteriota bacterium]
MDFLGCKIRHEFWPSSLRTGIPKRTYPPFDEEYFEWIDLLESVVQAQGTYTIVELGAGFGRWSVRAANAIRQYNRLPIHLVAVEAEPAHFAWLCQHLADNGITPEDHTLIQAAMTGELGEVLFYVGMPGLVENAPTEWYGQSIIKDHERPGLPDSRGAQFVEHQSGWRSIRVRALPFSAVLADLDRVDLVDMDVQGEEYNVVAAAIRDITAKVRRLHIGTHGHDIEGELRRLLLAFKWKCVTDYPCSTVSSTPWGSISFDDGVQSWINPELQTPAVD